MLAGPSPQGGRQEPGRRVTGFRPDRVTDLEGTLGYFEVFTPAITPFKRVSALDAVGLDGTTPVLGVGDPVRKPVPVEGLDAVPPDPRPRDRFWASVVLDFSEGNVVPLPTVSPESRLLSVQADNRTLSFERDGADNFFAVASLVGSRQVRLTYVIDAPRSYFGGALPEARTDVLAAQVFPLPEKVERDALTFAGELGLWRGMDSAQALRTLVEHFRGFTESKVAPRDTGNIFLDLARGKRGVCRHRGYAFVITAQALGVPARFVQNEAHAWVEVKLPVHGWVRIDLGGAAEGLDAHATRDKPFYRSGMDDPWPRPAAYAESYSRAERAQQTSSGAVARGSAGERARGERSVKPTLAASQSAASESRLPDGRTPVTLNVTRYIPEVLRGTGLEVEGFAQLRSGAPVPGLRIEVSLAATDQQRAVLLGVSVTDEAGRFRGTFSVPPSIEPDDYALVVVTPGDARHAAARAD
jgi:transglutaminase-like putative cysteine protease